MPWAIQYPQDHHTHPAWVHPAQVYESAMNLAFFAGLTWLHRRRHFDGQVFATYLLGYAVIRSIAEWYRGDYSVISNPAAGVFTPGQLTSALIITAGAGLYFIRRRHSPASMSTPRPTT